MIHLLGGGALLASADARTIRNELASAPDGALRLRLEDGGEATVYRHAIAYLADESEPSGE
jgi:hypothetical protein